MDMEQWTDGLDCHPQQLYPDSIETYTGRYVRPVDMKQSDFDIVDIAHALANKCRYTGHVRKFYSVAEHCVLMSLWFVHNNEILLAYDALMHDAVEAYVPDVARPMKRHVPELMEIEKNIQQRLSERFGFRYPYAEEVHRADRAMCFSEADVLMRSRGRDWGAKEEPLDVEISCLTPEQAEEAYLSMYETLTNALAVTGT